MINLYGADLFSRADQFKIIRGKNNAPGGEGGVDFDVQERLGAPGLETIGLEKIDRRHGICCGITIAWMIGFCHSVQGAQSTAYFDSYFRDVLRFQGAYLKDNKGNIRSIDDFANRNYVHGCSAINGKRSMTSFSVDNLGQGLPAKYSMYLGIWKHAIAAGVTSGRFYIMDPNAGLFAYFSQSDFEADMNDLIEARRTRKNQLGNAKISVWSYKKD